MRPSPRRGSGSARARAGGEFGDTWKNIHKYEKVEKAQHACYDDQGIPYSYDC